MMVEELDETLRGQKDAFLASLRSKQAKAMEQFERLSEAIQAIERALPDVEEGAGSALPASPKIGEVLGPELTVPVSNIPASQRSLPSVNSGWTSRLRNLTQYQALVRIAQDNGGVLRTTDARDILIRTGLSKGSPRNVYGSIYDKLNQSDEFERIGEGTFRLIPALRLHVDDHERGEDEGNPLTEDIVNS